MNKILYMPLLQIPSLFACKVPIVFKIWFIDTVIHVLYNKYFRFSYQIVNSFVFFYLFNSHNLCYISLMKIITTKLDCSSCKSFEKIIISHKLR